MVMNNYHGVVWKNNTLWHRQIPELETVFIDGRVNRTEIRSQKTEDRMWASGVLEL
jgi:hypothetical protein